jgi:hypothetical protein
MMHSLSAGLALTVQLADVPLRVPTAVSLGFSALKSTIDAVPTPAVKVTFAG